MLIVMSGLPGTGKSALAQAFGREHNTPVLSVDPVEAALWRAGVDRDQPTGLAAYVVVEAVAADLLDQRQPVVIDAVNDAEEAREQWRRLADRHGLRPHFVEVVCSDPVVHRRRLERRVRDLPGFPEPTWESVQARRSGFADWSDERLVVDTVQPLEHNVWLMHEHLTGGQTARVRERARRIAQKDAGLLRRLAEWPKEE